MITLLTKILQHLTSRFMIWHKYEGSAPKCRFITTIINVAYFTKLNYYTKKNRLENNLNFLHPSCAFSMSWKGHLTRFFLPFSSLASPHLPYLFLQLPLSQAFRLIIFRASDQYAYGSSLSFLFKSPPGFLLAYSLPVYDHPSSDIFIASYFSLSCRKSDFQIHS